MEIKKSVNGNVAQLNVFGRLDAVTSIDLQASLEEVVQDKNVTKLVLDFNDVEYISSAGLRVILNMQKIINSANHSMNLINVNDDVMSVFKITGFDEFLSITKK